VNIGRFRQEVTVEEMPKALDETALRELLEMLRWRCPGSDPQSVRLLLQELIETEAAHAQKSEMTATAPVSDCLSAGVRGAET
jgi:hypothetical protein